MSCFVIHKYGNGKQRLLVAADPCASSPVTQSQRVHTKERRTLLNAYLPTKVIIACRVCLVLAMVSARGISGKTIRNSFRHQRRTSNFHILLAGLVMRPPIRTKISQPTPQSRCIGFGPGEPCRQAFSVGGAETAVGRHAVLSCERPIVPAITGHSAAIMNAGCVSPIGNSAIRVSIITASLQSINREFGRVAICPILVWGAACCMEKEEAKELPTPFG